MGIKIRNSIKLASTCRDFRQGTETYPAPDLPRPIRDRRMNTENILVKIDGAFEKKKFVDILSRLVGTNEQPNEVLSALGEVFGVKVAPLMIVTGEGDGESSFSAWSWF